MALSFLSPKVLRIEVTEGVDLESGLFLRGERLTIGSGPDDDLRLGAAGVVPGHLTLTRQPGAKAWEYFASDRGRTEVDSGNPRTGTVRAGMWFRLGGDTRLDIQRAPAPPEQKAASGETAEKTEVPLAVALPIMAVMAAAFLFYILSLGQTGGPQGAMRTTAWFTGEAPIEGALDECLLASRGLDGALRVEPGAPDALFVAWGRVSVEDSVRATAIRDRLAAEVREIIAQAHFLAREARYGDASAALRRLENVLPVGNAACPILSAARSDLALLQIRAD